MSGSAVMAGLRALGWAVRTGMADHGVIFTVWSWFFGWFLRILAQVLFFVVIGGLLGPEQRRFLFVGNAVLLMAAHSLLATASTTWERNYGTFALLVASPTSPGLVLFGRSLFWVPEGLACAVGALLILGPVAGLSLSVTTVLWCLPVLLLIGLTTYALGIFLGALALLAVDLRNVMSSAMLTLMMVLCGVNLPAGALGTVPGAVAAALPLTHGLRAVREIVAGTVDGHVALLALAELGVGIGWFAAAAVVMRLLAVRSRVDGAPLFAD
jgi:ABC-2 type transport system permease protein